MELMAISQRKEGSTFKMLGTMTSIAASLTVAVFFVSSQGWSVWSVMIAILILLLGVLAGKRYDHLSYLAKKDDLTDCYNRRFIRGVLNRLMRSVQKNKRPLCIALIDLDDFKRVNNDLGQLYGDHLLRTFSGTLMAVCPRDSYVSRLGDDEFIVIAPNLNMQAMEDIIQSFHQKLKSTYTLSEVKYSVGIAQYPINGDSYEALIKYAEEQMYGMKWSNAQEENKEKYVNYIRQNQKQITEQWLSMVKKHHEQVASIIKPEVFQLLFDYLLDFGPDSKVNRQKLMASLPEYCRYLYEQGITSEKISIFMTVMRHLLMGNYDAVFKPFPIHVVKEVINRLDTLETEINRQYARLELIKRENDMTELHEDRLSLIGKMAASMAHEIRNPLTSIKGFLKLIRANIPSDASPNIEKYINIIESEFENIHMQITGLLSFSKKQIIEESFSYLSANQLLHSMISLLSPRLINENVELEVNEREVFHIHGQKVALQQVISNILNNGIDALAMNQDREKRMRIEIYSDDRASYISISNNGPEIPHEVRGVLFRPFTTTKEDGTGLGLAICKQIMEKNNGDISFESGPDETTFTLIFYKEEVRSEARVRVGPSRTAM
jgi:diguanylate cyclase (GGDEF)-like protein